MNNINRLWERLEEIRRERKNLEQSQSYEYALDLFYFLLDNYEEIQAVSKLDAFERRINLYLYNYPRF